MSNRHTHAPTEKTRRQLYQRSGVFKKKNNNNKKKLILPRSNRSKSANFESRSIFAKICVHLTRASLSPRTTVQLLRSFESNADKTVEV